MTQKKMNNFFQELKKNLAEIPSRVEGTNTAEFLKFNSEVNKTLKNAGYGKNFTNYIG